MLVPFEKYCLITSLSPEEVHDRLISAVDTVKHFKTSLLMNRPEKSYYGQVSPSAFKIQRKITYRNSSLPIVKGQVSSFAGQTRIDIQMRPHAFVSAFMLVWLIIVGMGCIAIGIAAIQRILHPGEMKLSPMMLIPFGMFLVGYLGITLVFKWESKKAKEFLAKLLEKR